MEFFTSLLGSIWSVSLIILFFGGSIFVHELGHFLAARRRGVKVERFSIGFGPAIFSWRGKDGVEYRISWLPLGGYVALPQLASMAAIEGESDAAEALPPISYSTRMIVFAAGAFCNVIFALVLASILWLAGRPAPEYITTTRIGYVIPTLKLPDGQEVPSPALAAGLHVNDIIRQVDGRTVQDWNQFKSALILGTSTTEDGLRAVQLTIERDGRLLTVTANPRRTGDERLRTLGVSPAYAAIIDQVSPGSPAAKLGFQPDDEIVTFEGQTCAAPDALYDFIRNHKQQPVRVGVMRNGRIVEIALPAFASIKAHPLTGLSLRTNVKLLHDTPWAQFYDTVDMTFRTLWSLVSPRGDLSFSNLSGPIGIGRGFWNAGQSDFPLRYAIWFSVLININLAVFNLLPIPVLDGGHMLFATIGKLRGRMLPDKFVAATQSVFILLLFTMILYVSVFDVRRIVQDNRAETEAREAAAHKQADEP